MKIVIPFFGNDPQRKRIFDAVYNYYVNESPYEVISFLDGVIIGNRSGARNYLIRNHTDMDDVIAIIDADVFVEIDALDEALGAVQQGSSWAIAYDKWGYHRLKEEESERYLQLLEVSGGSGMWRPLRSHCIQGGGFKSYASALVMTRRFFEDCHGYDTRFKGWGFEDDAFREVALTLGGEPFRPNRAFLTHFWHPEPMGLTWDQPDIGWNKSLHAEYMKRKGHKEAMTEFLEAR